MPLVKQPTTAIAQNKPYSTSLEEHYPALVEQQQAGFAATMSLISSVTCNPLQP
jgi:hypothetical protein